MSDDIKIANDEGLSPQEIKTLLDALKREHKRINTEVDALHENGVTDMLKLKRMKKMKLSVKDRITYLENMLTPDILA